MEKIYRCQFKDKEQTWDMDHDEAKAYVKNHPGWHIVEVGFKEGFATKAYADDIALKTAKHPQSSSWLKRVSAFFRRFIFMPRFSKGALEEINQAVSEVHAKRMVKQLDAVRKVIDQMDDMQKIQLIQEIGRIYHISPGDKFPDEKTTNI